MELSLLLVNTTNIRTYSEVLHVVKQELSYRITCQLHTQYVEGSSSNTVTLKSLLRSLKVT